MRARSLISAAFFLFPMVAYSQAVITSASISDNVLTIEGNGFGSDSPMVFWDDTKNSFTFTSANSGDLVGTGADEKWNIADSPWGNPMEYAHNNLTKVGKTDAYYRGVGKKAILGSPNIDGSLDQKMYVSWWYRPSMSPSAEGGSNKFIRIWDKPDGTGTRISWTQMHLTCGDGSVVSWKDWSGAPGEWNRHEFYVDTTNNTVQVWVNGKSLHNLSNCPKIASGIGHPVFVQLIGFDHGSSSYGSMETHLDDIYIGNTKKRIELSNEATWSSTTVSEPVPITSWSDTVITAAPYMTSKVRFSKDLYIYIFDDNGNVNENGHKINCLYCPNYES
ncbi:DUF1080 domain-containing protein [Simiduia sp. 21SJ11W-1]|uniref:DUF1080 domain-containing protein n=1 Tax=Simiduia sp. 21SJ11W-1 TaxID=2909669 RepID=UPI0020A0556A|nr:DUF1080 domain-containing protein [Simiduia sp. 21SJ11W-1]UTA47368.1 DUF1080 domain-containing protein [Simiduia sp. 21SJ11W-1]